MAQSIKEQKISYRKRLKEIINRLDEQTISEQSTAVTKKAIVLPEFQQAKAISVFLSMPGKEISTNEIVLQALKDGKKVFIPYIYPEKSDPKSKVMDMLQLHDEQDLRSLNSDAWGIPSLPSETIDQRENALGGFGVFDQSKNGAQITPILDLIFVPAMAFDQNRNRLGHGKGFYDRYMTKYRDLSSHTGSEMIHPFLVGLALDQQVLDNGEQLPTTAEDWKVDLVIHASSS